MTTLRSLIGESADADLLREMIGFGAQMLMAPEVGAKTVAGHGEKNGPRGKAIATGIGGHGRVL